MQQAVSPVQTMLSSVGSQEYLVELDWQRLMTEARFLIVRSR